MIVLGRMVFSGGTDFVAVYGTGPGVIVDLDGQRFQRLLLTGVPADAVSRLREAVAARAA